MYMSSIRRSENTVGEVRTGGSCFLPRNNSMTQTYLYVIVQERSQLQRLLVDSFRVQLEQLTGVFVQLGPSEVENCHSETTAMFFHPTCRRREHVSRKTSVMTAWHVTQIAPIATRCRVRRTTPSTHTTHGITACGRIQGETAATSAPSCHSGDARSTAIRLELYTYDTTFLCAFNPTRHHTRR